MGPASLTVIATDGIVVNLDDSWFLYDHFGRQPGIATEFPMNHPTAQQVEN
jgi:hypothetical protein